MNKKVVTVVVSAVGLYSLYKYGTQKGWFSAPSLNPNDTSGGTTPPTSGGTNTSGVNNPNIRALQDFLHIQVDGVAGKQTNAWIEYYWSAFDNPYNAEAMFNAGYPNAFKNGKGVVTENNAIYYLDTLRLASSPRQRFNTNQPQVSTTQNAIDLRMAEAKKIQASYRTFGVLKFKAKTNVLSYKKVGNAYQTDGTQYTYSADSAFLSTLNRSRVTIDGISVNGYLIISVNPVLGTSFIALINPFDVYISNWE